MVYQVVEGDGRATYAQRVSPSGKLMWPGEGTPLFFAKYTFAPTLTACIVDDGAGGAIVVWGQDDGLKAQRLNSDGNALWGTGGLVMAQAPIGPVSTIADGSGGVIVAWGFGLRIVRMSSEAKPSSPIVTVLSAGGFGPHGIFDIVGDKLGNVLLVWEDNRKNIFAQKIGPGSDVLWPEANVEVATGKGTGSAFYSIASDGAGGAIVTWVAAELDERGGIINHHLYVQKISSQGKRLWDGDGALVLPNPQGQSGFVGDPVSVQDAEGGVIIFWYTVAPFSIRAQRIDGSGNSLWSEGGITVWDGRGAPTNPFFSAVSDDHGGAIIVWNDSSASGRKTDGYPLFRAQRLSSEGDKLWGEGGAPVAVSPTGLLQKPTASKDGAGGVIVAWAAGPDALSIKYSYVQRIDSEGHPRFGAEGASPQH